MDANGVAVGLDELSWVDVAAHLARDPRLLIPVGALEQHGPHLPLGTNVLIARRLALDLSRELGVLRAPAFHYGVNVRTERAFAGTAALTRKTLHRALNELLAAWEAHGVTEFILITTHRHEPHLEALASLLTRRARVRVVDAWDVDIDDLLEAQAGPLHAGEAETSVMLFLYPELVRMDRARDFELPPGEFEKYLRGGLPVPPPGSAGVVGRPTAASAHKGEQIYRRILESIRRSVFEQPRDRESDTV
ncbi:MAG: creatininase family protein [Gemmatimonadetes bacterium]|nr:creatininase family protein [Gemmatimonadota bacterium]